MTQVVRSPFKRGLYLVAGILCLLGLALSWLPGIPTGDLAFLAAFFFAKSSDRLHNWIVNHRVLGPLIANYRSGGLTQRTKVTATLGIVLSLGASMLFLIDNMWLRIVLFLVGCYAVWFVWSRPTRTLTVPSPG